MIRKKKPTRHSLVRYSRSILFHWSSALDVNFDGFNIYKLDSMCFKNRYIYYTWKCFRLVYERNASNILPNTFPLRLFLWPVRTYQTQSFLVGFAFHLVILSWFILNKKWNLPKLMILLGNQHSYKQNYPHSQRIVRRQQRLNRKKNNNKHNNLTWFDTACLHPKNRLKNISFHKNDYNIVTYLK